MSWLVIDGFRSRNKRITGSALCRKQVRVAQHDLIHPRIQHLVRDIYRDAQNGDGIPSVSNQNKKNKSKRQKETRDK
jgi:hypothetical protein